MKQRMKVSNGSVRAVVAQSLARLEIDTLQTVGKLETIYKVLRNNRNNFLNEPPYIFPELKLGYRLTHTETGGIFFQYGKGNYGNLSENENYLIFYSTTSVAELIRNAVWCVDGTFCVVPKPWYQLFTVGFLKNAHVYPVLFCIMKNRYETTYSGLWDTIFSLIGRCSPMYIKTDFEKASLSALLNAFPTSRISTCLFHLGQSLIRKLKKENLYNYYVREFTYKKYVKSLMALSYVDREFVQETFYELKAQKDFPELLNCVYDYFFRTYISDSASFPISIWNAVTLVFEDVPKTNNALEAWHNVFKSSFGTSKYNFVLLIEKLRQEEELIRQKILRSSAGEEIHRNTRYVRMEENLKVLIQAAPIRHGIAYVFSLVEVIFY